MRSSKRSALLSMVVEAGLSGLTAFAPTFSQLTSMTSVLGGYLRVFEEGKAFTSAEDVLAAPPVPTPADRNKSAVEKNFASLVDTTMPVSLQRDYHHEDFSAAGAASQRVSDEFCAKCAIARCAEGLALCQRCHVTNASRVSRPGRYLYESN